MTCGNHGIWWVPVWNGHIVVATMCTMLITFDRTVYINHFSLDAERAIGSIGIYTGGIAEYDQLDCVPNTLSHHNGWVSPVDFLHINIWAIPCNETFGLKNVSFFGTDKISVSTSTSCPTPGDLGVIIGCLTLATVFIFMAFFCFVTFYGPKTNVVRPSDLEPQPPRYEALALAPDQTDTRNNRSTHL